MRFLRILACWLAFAGTAAAEERHLHTYTMQGALPEQVLPALEAQLSPGSSITPYMQQLILNVTDREYRSIVELLGQLDVAARSLLISVRSGTRSGSEDSRYGIDGRIGAGDVQVGTGDGGRRSGTRIDINRSTHSGSEDGTQQVRAVEGTAAYIDAGNVYSMRVDRYGSREQVPVTTGFYATARIIGDEVIVDIDQHDDRLQGGAARAGNIRTQGVQTQVRGRLGSWIPLGALQSNSSGSDRAIAAYTGSNATSTTDLAIKVDLAD